MEDVKRVLVYYLERLEREERDDMNDVTRSVKQRRSKSYCQESQEMGLRWTESYSARDEI